MRANGWIISTRESPMGEEWYSFWSYQSLKPQSNCDWNEWSDVIWDYGGAISQPPGGERSDAPVALVFLNECIICIQKGRNPKRCSNRSSTSRLAACHSLTATHGVCFVPRLVGVSQAVILSFFGCLVRGKPESALIFLEVYYYDGLGILSADMTVYTSASRQTNTVLHVTRASFTWCPLCGNTMW